jgi:competence protein ComFC
LLKDFFKEALTALAGFFFPSYCRVCGKESGEDGIVCGKCRSGLIEKAMAYVPTGKDILPAEEVIVFLPYDRTVRSLIHDLKYRGIHSLGFLFGSLMAQKAGFHSGNGMKPLLVPVPLHPKKLKSRGYNQSERLAAGIASVTGFSVDETLISRARFTETQTTLSHDSRKENVSGAFVYSGVENLSGVPVILIDDVLTTGSTVSECAKILKDNGARKIIVMAVASPDIGDE